MRWEIIEKCWALARKSHPKVKRLYIDVPNEIKSAGKCSVFDLETPSSPLNVIKFDVVMTNGNPEIKLSLDKDNVKTSSVCPITMKISYSIENMNKKNTIIAGDIMERYKDAKDLGEQLAFLIVGHDEGLVKQAGNKIAEQKIINWISRKGFPEETIPFVKSKLEELGIVVAKKEPIFQNYAKVRIVDPTLREYNEGAQVLKHIKDKNKIIWYLVLVDGSEKPIMVNESQLAKNEVGSIKNISIVDEQGKI